MSASPHIQSRRFLAFSCLTLLAIGGLSALTSLLTNRTTDKPADKRNTPPALPKVLNRFITAKGRRDYVESHLVKCDVNADGQDLKIVHVAPEGAHVEAGEVIIELDSSALAQKRTEQTALVESLRLNLSHSSQTEKDAQPVQAQLDLEEQKLQALERDIAKCKIHAPLAGRVLYGQHSSVRSVDRRTLAAIENETPVGLIVPSRGTVRPQQILVSVFTTQETLVRAMVKESDVVLVRPGMSVELSVADHPDLTTTGKVEKVNQYADPGNGPPKYYAVYISAVDTDHKLRSDMKIDVQILIGPDTTGVE